MIKLLKTRFKNNIDFIIKTITVGGTILAMVSAVLYLRTDIKSQISAKLNDPAVIEEIANKIKPPVIIFNEKGTVLYDDGGSEYIRLGEIKTKFDKKIHIIESITIPTKKFSNIAPILSSIDNGVYFHEAERVDTYTWEYKIVKIDEEYGIRSNEDMAIPISRYRLEVIR